MNVVSKRLEVLDLGRTRYGEAWDFQRTIFDNRLAGKRADSLLLTEHDHVYTIGKNGSDAHLLANEAELTTRGAEVFHIDRGGDITYHGPGQLVGYPIIKLDDYYEDVHRYLRDIEEVILRTIAEYGITGKRENDYTGVWAGSDKIAAIGVKVSHWITMHGFALNVNTDLTYFDRIIPCGIFHKGVTSLQKILGYEVSMDDVKRKIIHHFQDVFQVQSTVKDGLAVQTMFRNDSGQTLWHR